MPSLPEIHRLVTDDQHLVLQFTVPATKEDSTIEDSAARDTATEDTVTEDTVTETTTTQVAAFDKRVVIDRLAGMLPEYSIFDGGGRAGGIELVTIKKVVARQDVLDKAERIGEAARDFRLTAQDLMARLAHHLHIPIEEFCNGRYWSRLPDKEGRGAMDAEWRYYFHGVECCFTSIATGQTLDVILEHENEFGVLDPYFFWKFVATTPEWHDVAGLLKNDYHDAVRAFEVLEEQGLLKRLPSNRPYQRCLVVSDIVMSGSNVSGI